MLRFHIWFIIIAYYKMRQKSITKMHQVFYYKMRQFYYKMRQSLQVVTMLLQNARVFTKCDVYYKLRFRLFKIFESLKIVQNLHKINEAMFSRLVETGGLQPHKLVENSQKFITICNIHNMTSTRNVWNWFFFLIFDNNQSWIQSSIKPIFIISVKRKWIYLLQFKFPFNAISEGSFSALKRLKTKMQSTTHNGRLYHLILLYVYQE